MKMKLIIPVIVAFAGLFVAGSSHAQDSYVKDDGTAVVYGASVRGLKLLTPDVKAQSNYDAAVYLKQQLNAKNIVVPKGTFTVMFVVEATGNVSSVNVDDRNNLLDTDTKNAMIETLYTLPIWTAAKQKNNAVASVVVLNNVSF